MNRTVRAVAGAAVGVACLVACTPAAPQPSTAPLPTSTSLRPVPATTAAPATPGDISSTVAPREQTSAAPARVGQSVEIGTGVEVEVTRVRAVDAKPTVPGQTGGAALAVDLEVVNKTDAELNLGSLIVNVADDAGRPSAPLEAKPGKPLPSTVKAGGTATGVYVFAAVKTKSKAVVIQVIVSPDLPMATFEGTVA